MVVLLELIADGVLCGSLCCLGYPLLFASLVVLLVIMLLSAQLHRVANILLVITGTQSKGYPRETLLV